MDRFVFFIILISRPISLQSISCDNIEWNVTHESNHNKRGIYQTKNKVFAVYNCSHIIKTDKERIEILKGKQIVMIGDSVQRNLYTNLAHFIHTKDWYSIKPHIEYRVDFHTWENYYKSSNQRFGCYEYCDCCELENAWNGKTPATVEIKANRYYYNPHYNIKLNYHFNKGLCLPIPFIIQGSFFDTQSTSILESDRCNKPSTIYCHKNNNEHEISLSLLTFAQTYLYNYKPDIIIINQGFWDYCNYYKLNITLMSELFITLNNTLTHNGHLIWRGTTRYLGESKNNNNYLIELKMLENIGYKIFDAYKYTMNLPYDAYEPGNKHHLAPSVCEELNKRLIDMIYTLTMQKS